MHGLIQSMHASCHVFLKACRRQRILKAVALEDCAGVLPLRNLLLNSLKCLRHCAQLVINITKYEYLLSIEPWSW